MNYSKLISFCFLFASVIFTSCEQKTNTPQTDTSKLKKIKIDNTDFSRVFSLDQVIDSTRVVALQTTNDCLLGKIDRLFFADNRIIIVDKYNTKSIFFFDRQGKFLSKIDKKGKGAGEYISMHDVIFADSLVEIFDDALSKIIRYDLNGKYKNESPLLPFSKSKFAKDANGSYLLFNINEPTSFGNFKLYNWDVKSNAPVATFLPFDDLLATNKRYEFETPFNYGYLDGKRTLKFKEMFNDTVYAFNAGKLIADYKFEFEENPLPENYSNDFSINDKDATVVDENYARYLGGYCEIKDYLLFYYEFNQIINIGLWDKINTKMLANTNLAVLKKYNILLPYIWFNGPKENGIVTTYEAQDLINWAKQQKKNKNITATDLYQRAVNLTANDNPVLLFIDLKRVQQK